MNHNNDKSGDTYFSSLPEEKIDIVILNWNSWQDTIQCLESVFRNEHPNYRVILCDNGSSDGSMENITAWAEGKLSAVNDGSELFQQFCQPAISKPLNYQLYTREEAERADNKTSAQLVLIQTGDNLGFAGGNNVGIRYSLAQGDSDYIWLLNNDTVIKPDSLTHLVQRMRLPPTVGMCGSNLVFYDNPDFLQARAGAKFIKWLGIAIVLGKLNKVDEPVNQEAIEKSLDYIIGASMLVSTPLLRKIGLMDDSYFLYYEEIDWAVRAKKYFSLAYAPKSFVYHKVGGSIGSHRKSTQRSELADYYLLKSRLKFTRKFYPYALPTVYLELLFEALLRALRGQWNRAGNVVKILTGKQR